MRKVRSIWRLPVTLSFVLGFVPAMFALLGAFYGFGDNVLGGLVVLCIVLLLIWAPALVVFGVRKLKAR
jgi:hypothetical protein